MNVKQLKELLSKYPEDMTVLHSQHSDYVEVDDDFICIKNAVNMSSWFMRSHPTMSDENVKKEKQYLILG